MKVFRDMSFHGGRRLLHAFAAVIVASTAPALAEARADQSAAPGHLISQDPIKGAPDGAAAWKIRYATLDQKGEPEEVTGIVVVPAGAAPTQGRDVVAWGRGTVGLAPVCAPSKTPKSMFENTPGVPEMLKRGYVVAAPDFADTDSNRPHPYLVGLAEAHAMLDVVRAVAQMPEAHASRRYALWGESEGAHAALWSAKLAPSYAAGLDLVGIAADAPPTDLVKNFDMITSPGVRALITGYVADSWSKVYGIPLSTFANGFGQTIIHQLAKDCTRFDIASAFTNTTLLILSNQVPHRLGAEWLPRLQENSIAAIRLPAPLLLAQGGKDDVVMPPLTRMYAQDSCRLGDDVRLIWKPDEGHLTITTSVMAPTIEWLADRFAGKTPPSDCRELLKAAGDPPSDAHRAGG